MKSGTPTCRRFFLQKQASIVISFFALLSAVSNLHAQSGLSLSLAELPSALKRANPGDVLLLRSGEYSDQELSLAGQGEKDRPIVIRAEKPGSITLTGASSITIKGDWIALEGIYFTKGNSPQNDVISISGSHCRLSNCAIDDYNSSNLEEEKKWVSLKGDHHIVEYCTFRNKTSKGVTLTVWREDSSPNSHIIRRNHFLNRPKGAQSNGYETIRIGTSHESMSDSLTVITENLFQQCDGEMEIISIKSGKNTIRDNTFDLCAGTLTLRHGNGSKVEKNIFLGRNKKETGGIRVYGSGHSISGNAIIGTTGRAGAAIALMTGTPKPALNGFHAAKLIQVTGNLIVANTGPAFKLDTYLGEDNRTELPTGILVQSNSLSGSDLKNLVLGAAKIAPGELIWDKNKIFRDNQIPNSITGKIAPPLSTSDVGAPWFRHQIQK